MHYSPLSEADLKRIIKGGETSTVELMLAAPRAVDLAERFCGMTNAKGGLVIIGVEDSTHKIVGVADECMGETVDSILRAARQVIKSELMLAVLSLVPYTLYQGIYASFPEYWSSL